MVDRRWSKFDECVVEKCAVVLKRKPFQEKMVSHCDVVLYDEGVKLFGIVEVGAGSGKKSMSMSFKNRRKDVIDSLIEERKKLRRKKRKARSEIEKNGYEALLRVLAGRLMKLRRAEKRRQKQREMRRV